ncbi:MAG TPA: acyltransferase family protein [Xylella sp.]
MLRARTPYFSSIQLLRGIAAVLVVLCHVVHAEVVHGRGKAILSESLAQFGYAGVDLFFVISGFVMTTVIAGKYGSGANAARFLIRRGMRILPLYWLFTTAIIVLMYVRPGTIDSSYQERSILASYLLWPQSALPHLQVGWTLSYEAFFYLTMTSAIAFVQEQRVPLFFVAWATILLVLQTVTNTSPWGHIITSPMGWEFIAGALVGIYWRRLPAHCAGVCLWLGIVGFFGAAVVLQALRIFSEFALLRTLVFGIPSVLMVLGTVRAESAGKLSSSKWLNWLGDASYSIYLSHLLVLTLLSRLWSVSGLNQQVWQHIGFIFTTIIACCIAGWLSYRFIERPLLSIGDRLLPRKDFTNRTLQVEKPTF